MKINIIHLLDLWFVPKKTYWTKHRQLNNIENTKTFIDLKLYKLFIRSDLLKKGYSLYKE